MTQLPVPSEPEKTALRTLDEGAGTAESDSIGALLGRRVRATKASFFLGLALYAAAFVAFVFLFLDPLGPRPVVAAFAGFAAGFYYLVLGTIWSLLWSVAVQLNLLGDELTQWAGGVLRKAVRVVRETVATGDVVDLRIVRAQIEALVEAQTQKLEENKRWGPIVNEYAPDVVRQGVRALLMRYAGRVWPSDELTIEQLERGLQRFSGEATVRTVRKFIWVALGLLLVLGAIVIAIPLGVTALVAALL